MTDLLPRQIFPAGAKIFTEGDEGHFAYAIEQGTVEVSQLSKGRKVVLARLGDGELLGEMALVDGSPRSATAVATEETQVIVFERDDLQNRVNQADPLVELLVRMTLDRLRTAQRVMLDTTAQALGSKCRAEHVRGRHKLEADLQAAIDSDSLSLHYQPIVDLSNGRVAGFEALVRWDHPEHGTVVPSSFIKLAEETGMIVPMGRWMLRRALEGQKQLQAVVDSLDGESRPIGISVNISNRQLFTSAEVDDLMQIVKESGVSSESVVFEITETLLVEDPDHVLEAMRKFQSQGIRIAADDFGTGYANLAFLHRFPLDILKIDRMFITSMVGDPRSRKIVSTVIDLAKDLGMSIVAEGIEDKSEIEVLQELGCDCGQGFLLARPVPQEKAELLVRQRVRW